MVIEVSFEILLTRIERAMILVDTFNVTNCGSTTVRAGSARALILLFAWLDKSLVSDVVQDILYLTQAPVDLMLRSI